MPDPTLTPLEVPLPIPPPALTPDLPEPSVNLNPQTVLSAASSVLSAAIPNAPTLALPQTKGGRLIKGVVALSLIVVLYYLYKKGVKIQNETKKPARKTQSEIPTDSAISDGSGDSTRHRLAEVELKPRERSPHRLT